MLRVLIGGFLIAHGLVHIPMWVAVAAPQPGKTAAFDASHSWLLGSARGLAAPVATLVAIVLVVAGIALFVHSGLWRPLALAGLAGSLFMTAVYFHPWFTPITAINVALMYAIAVAHWPSAAAVGA